MGFNNKEIVIRASISLIGCPNSITQQTLTNTFRNPIQL